MLIWCLKQVKNFILKFLISGHFFSEKEFLNLYAMIFIFVQVDMLMRSATIVQIIKDTNMFIFFSITY